MTGTGDRSASKNVTRPRFTTHVGLALRVGVVGGFVLGCGEALHTLHANAAIQPGQYFWVYLSVPILAWMALGALLMLLAGLVVAAARRLGESLVALWLHAGLFTLVGMLSITLPSIGAITTRLHDVGAAAGVFGHVVLYTLALAMAGTAALTVAASVASYAAATLAALRHATRVAVVMCLLLLVPVGRFLTTDWKWAGAVPEAAARAAVPGPNVVLISIDTLRADHLGSYGSPHGLTPHLDRLGAAGVLFEQAITSSPWTLPAMASVVTGLDPRHHRAGQITNRRDPLGRSPLPAGSWTLATALHAHGYRTHAIVTNPYLALHYGLGAGFDGYENVTIESEAWLSFADTTAARLLTWLWLDLVVGDRGDTVSRRAVRWLTGAAADQHTGSPADRHTGSPFFLWLHYIDPHPPYSRAGATRNKSFRGDISFDHADTDGASLAIRSPDVARLRSGEIRLSPVEKDAVRGLYRAEVAAVDEAVGAVVEAIDRLGLHQQTLVVCVADHGEEFWEHGGVEHGQTVYDEVVRVPLMMRWPGRLPAGARVASVVRVTDIAPTIVDLLGLPTPAALDGATLLPLVRGEVSAPRVARSENLLFAEERIGLRSATHSYIRWENGTEEAYDLSRDPRQRRDLAGIDAVVAPLRQLYVATGDGAAAQAPPAQSPAFDSTSRAALRALGYLQ